MEFKGKVVVIHGAVNDVGRAVALDFARHQAQVILIDSDAAALQALCAAIAGEGGQATAFTAPLDDPEALDAVAGRCAQADVLVVSPMTIKRASILESSVDSWRRVVSENLLGAVFVCRAFFPLLRRAGHGAVVHVGSIDGTLGNPTVPSYSAAKGGIAALTHVMAAEFGAQGVRVNCVARAMMANPGEEHDPRFRPLAGQTPLGRPALPHEVAAAVRFLASQEASYINGVILPVDGGRSALTPGTFSRS